MPFSAEYATLKNSENKPKNILRYEKLIYIYMLSGVFLGSSVNLGDWGLELI